MLILSANFAPRFQDTNACHGYAYDQGATHDYHDRAGKAGDPGDNKTSGHPSEQGSVSNKVTARFSSRKETSQKKTMATRETEIRHADGSSMKPLRIKAQKPRRCSWLICEDAKRHYPIGQVKSYELLNSLPDVPQDALRSERLNKKIAEYRW